REGLRRFQVAMKCPSLIQMAHCSFFFSSRRRHTRFSRDWSSDVCSSDLDLSDFAPTAVAKSLRSAELRVSSLSLSALPPITTGEIGRASCRERVESSVAGEEEDTATNRKSACMQKKEEAHEGSRRGSERP